MGKVSGFNKSSTTTTTKSEDSKEKKKFSGKFKANNRTEFKGSSSYRSAEERKELMENNQCFTCKKVGHRSKDCPTKSKKEEASKPETETASKKARPSAGLHGWRNQSYRGLRALQSMG